MKSFLGQGKASPAKMPEAPAPKRPLPAEGAGAVAEPVQKKVKLEPEVRRIEQAEVRKYLAGA